MKSATPLALALSLAVIVMVGNSAEPGADRGPARDAYGHNSLIGRGVNLGNMLEAPREGQWGARLEEEYFELIEQAGFDSVRIPIRWSAHASGQPPFTIDEEFFTRVDWAVKQALSRELVAVINIHHYNEMMQDPAAHRERFVALWKQISARYKSHPEGLYFELLNEPHGKLSSSLWNSYLSEAVKVIRRTNPRRMIVIGPASWNNISKLDELQLPRGDRRIIVTFHYYSPFHFTHQGAGWVSGSNAWLGTKWQGTDKEKQDLTADFDKAAAWAEKEDRPLLLGEFGAFSKADMESRARWTSAVTREAQRRGISWAYWEFCSGFGVYDKDARQWRAELNKALLPD